VLLFGHLSVKQIGIKEQSWIKCLRRNLCLPHFEIHSCTNISRPRRRGNWTLWSFPTSSQSFVSRSDWPRGVVSYGHCRCPRTYGRCCQNMDSCKWHHAAERSPSKTTSWSTYLHVWLQCRCVFHSWNWNFRLVREDVEICELVESRNFVRAADRSS